MDINKHIELLNQILDWLKANDKNQYEKYFFTLIKERLHLKVLKDALGENPGIAAYGESQKGKSYLIGNLLQNNGAPFMIEAPGYEYNFVEDINPIGGGKEATGVVTRFTSFKLFPERYNADYPVLMKVFSVAEIVSILCDGFHNDVMDYISLNDDEIKERANDIYNKYISKPDVQEIIIEDDILSIKSYIHKFIHNAQYLSRSIYLDKLALVIRKIPVSEWNDAFKIFWIDNTDVSQLFIRLIECLGKINYEQEIYLPIDAVLHLGQRPRTIMSVDCLKGLYGTSDNLQTDVYLPQKTSVISIGRSLLSAICSEVVFKVADRYLNTELEFSTEMLDENSIQQIKNTFTEAKFNEADKCFKFERSLLNYSDLLDFPGARNRESLKVEFLNKLDPEDGSSNMIKILLRGKVAFLFNCYSDSRRINLLMFCHDAKNVAVTSMFSVIEEWIKRYVGNTPRDRFETIQLADGISPFFAISTMFNIDMIEDESQSRLIPGQEAFYQEKLENILNDRWYGRFNLLYKDCFQASNVDWFNNWTGESEGFNNTYVLRDYKYSACSGKGNNLYKGYDELSDFPREHELALSLRYYELLKSTFTNNSEVQKFIRGSKANKTQKSNLWWDLSASMNNDGAALIIYNLTKASRKLTGVRNNQLNNQVKDILQKLSKIADNLYVRTDGKDLIPQAIKKARSICFELDTSCNNDNYFFGHLLQSLQLSTKEIYELVHEKITDPALIESVQSFKQYELIQRHLGEFDTEEEGWNKILIYTGASDRDYAKDVLKKKKVDIEILLKKSHKRMLNSVVISEYVLNYWIDKVSASSLANQLCESSLFDSAVMTLLIGHLIDTAKAFDLIDKMASLISSKTDVTNLSSVNEYYVTDVLKNIINDFVANFGYNYLSPEELDICRSIDNEQSLNAFGLINCDEPSVKDEIELAKLFSELNGNPQSLTLSFQRNYDKWLGYMLISFLNKNAANHPKIDNPIANEQIGSIYDVINKMITDLNI